MVDGDGDGDGNGMAGLTMTMTMAVLIKYYFCDQGCGGDDGDGGDLWFCFTF